MTDFNKDEFWKALERLYDSMVEQRESMSELRKSVERGAERQQR